MDGRTTGAIGPGLLVLVGITDDDGAEDRDWLVRKLVQLRIFDDDDGVMNRGGRRYGRRHPRRIPVHALCVDAQGQPAVVHRGGARRRSREPAFDAFVASLAAALGKPVPTGVFGAHMEVRLVNDGPVTIWLDSTLRA